MATGSEPRLKRDFQTLNLFVVLALLTILFVAGLKLVLFAPSHPAPVPPSEVSAQK
jgi:hypothetical protein